MVVLVSLGGCLDADDSKNESTSAEPPTGTDWNPDVRQIATNPNGQREAVISVSPGGDIILSCMHGEFAGPITALASTDEGETWNQLTLPADSPPAGDCATTIFDDGRWGFAASSRQGASTFVTADHGQTWITNHQAAVGVYAEGPVFNVDRPWVHAVGDQLWLAWMPGKDVPGTILARTSSDNGYTWTQPTLVGSPGMDSTNVRHAKPVDHDGLVYVAMMRYQVVREDSDVTGQRVLEIASSVDGQEWALERVLEDKRVVPDWPSLAITQSGHMVLMFTYTLDSGSRGIAVLAKPPGGSWSEPIEIHDPGQASSSWSWIDGGTGDQVAFIFHGAEIDGAKRVWMGTMNATTLEPSMWPVGEGLVEFASVDHAQDGTAWAAWTISDEAQFIARLEPT